MSTPFWELTLHLSYWLSLYWFLICYISENILYDPLECGCALSWRSASPDVSTPCLLFWMALYNFSVSRYTADVTVARYCMNSTISTHFPFHETDSISFGRECLVKLLWLVWSCASTALWFQHSQIKCRFLYLSQCNWEIFHHLCSIAIKSLKLKPFSAFCMHSWVFLEPICEKYLIVWYHNFEQSTWMAYSSVIHYMLALKDA